MQHTVPYRLKLSGVDIGLKSKIIDFCQKLRKITLNKFKEAIQGLCKFTL